MSMQLNIGLNNMVATILSYPEESVFLNVLIVGERETKIERESKRERKLSMYLNRYLNRKGEYMVL